MLAQTYDDYELIIVDDCSPDDTPEVVRALEDPRIRAVRHPENLGQSAAVNTGIRMARGEYVALLDDDDEWLPRKLQRQVATLDASDPGVGLAYTWLDVVDAAGARRDGQRSVISGDISGVMLDCQAPAPPSTYMVRAEAARDVGGFDDTMGMGNDLDFLLRLSMRWRVAVVRDVLVLMHSEGQARSKQWADADDDWATYLRSHLLRFDRELRERPRTFARLLRLLAITEMRRGNAARSGRGVLEGVHRGRGGYAEGDRLERRVRRRAAVGPHPAAPRVNPMTSSRAPGPYSPTIHYPLSTIHYLPCA